MPNRVIFLDEEYIRARKQEVAEELGISPDKVWVLPYIVGEEEEKFLKSGARWDNTKEVRSDTETQDEEA